jgi:hypothetical protein
MTAIRRYVSASTTAGGDGSTTGTAGATRAWTLTEALTSISGGVDYYILNNGTYSVPATITCTGSAGHTNPARYIGVDASTLSPLPILVNDSGLFVFSHLPQIVFANTFRLSAPATSNYLMFANLFISGDVNNTLFDVQGNINIFSNIHLRNISNGAASAAFRCGFRCSVNDSSFFGNGANSAIASTNTTETIFANNVFSAPSGTALALNNNCYAVNNLFYNTNRALAVWANSQGHAIISKNTFVNVTGYCIGVRNDIAFTGRVMIYDNLFVDSTNAMRQMDGNTIEIAPTGNRPLHFTCNYLYNTPLGTGFDPQFVYNNTSVTGTFPIFANTGQNVYLLSPSATGITRSRLGLTNPGSTNSINLRYIPKPR